MNDGLRNADMTGSGEGHEFHRLLYENNQDAILLTAPDGRIMAANPAACALFGMTGDELKAAGLARLFDAAEPDLVNALMEPGRTGKPPVELNGLHMDGTTLPLEVSTFGFRDHNGQLRTTVMARDISGHKRLAAELGESNAHIQNVLENLPDVLYTLNLAERRVTSFNRDSFLGYGYDELTAAGSIQKNIHPEDAAAVAAYWKNVLEGNAVGSIEYRVRSKEGKWEWVDSRKTFVTTHPDGTPKEIMVLLRVITDQKQAQEQIAHHARILENVNDVVIGTDENFNITYWNRAAQRIFGWKPEEVMGKDVSVVLRTTFSMGSREDSIRDISQSGIWKGEVIQFTRENLPVKIDASILQVRDSLGRVTGYVSTNRDITHHKEAEEKLRLAKAALETANSELHLALSREQRLARTDGLTDLFNRRHFFSIAEHEFLVAERYGFPTSLIIFDVDHFKQVNSRWGHQVGDDVLRQIARIAREQVRAADIPARYGGEEFVVFLPNSRAQEAENVAERIRKEVMDHRIEPGKPETAVTISLGIAEMTAGTKSLDDLIRNADLALFAAKAAGRNCVKVYSEGS